MGRVFCSDVRDVHQCVAWDVSPFGRSPGAATYWPTGSSSGNGTPNSSSLAKASAKSAANFSPASKGAKLTNILQHLLGGNGSLEGSRAQQAW